MQRKAWIEKYHKHWKKTRFRALLLWLAFVAVSLALAIAFDVEGTIDQIMVAYCALCCGIAATSFGVCSGRQLSEHTVTRHFPQLPFCVLPAVHPLDHPRWPVSYQLHPTVWTEWRTEILAFLVQNEAIPPGLFVAARAAAGHRLTSDDSTAHFTVLLDGTLHAVVEGYPAHVCTIRR